MVAQAAPAGGLDVPTAPTTRVPRFYCQQLPHPRLAEPLCALPPDESRHVRKVLRLTAGDAVELFDGQGQVASALIEGYDREVAVCRVVSVAQVRRTVPAVTVATAIPKGPLAEVMVDQLSQLGVDRLVPLQTSRSVVQPRDGKLERFERTATEAAKQCGRARVMHVTQTVKLPEALRLDADLKLILQPAAADPMPAGEFITALGHAGAVLLLVGPEGGFTGEEVAAAKQAGFHSWTLSPHVLRIGTAAAAAASIIRCLTM